MDKFGPTRASRIHKNQAGGVSGDVDGEAKVGKLPSRSQQSRVASGFEFSKAMMKFVEGASASMRPVEAVIGELAQSDVPVLLLAESGAGKHATARRIHDLGNKHHS